MTSPVPSTSPADPQPEDEPAADHRDEWSPVATTGDETARPWRRPLLVAVLAVVCLAIASFVVFTRSADIRAAPLVISEAGTVLWGQELDRPVEIAADNVTLRRLSVRTGGAAAIRIRDGVRGAVIEDTDIWCTDRDTDGIVAGNYTAVRVRAFGCREPFRHSLAAPATVTDSEHDGQRYESVPEPAEDEPAPPPLPTDQPSAAAPPPTNLQVPPTPISYWPGPTTTGVPPGTALSNSGSLTLRRDGQVLSNLNITGCVAVYARNVVIRNSRITCDSPTYSIRIYPSARNLLVENVEINGRGRNSAAVCCSNYTLRRVNIHSVIDGPRLSDNTAVVDSWIHDLSRAPGSHNDTLQTTGGSNITVRRNRLEPYRASTQDPMNACLMIGSTTAPAVRNLLFEDNYCDGGNYSIGVRTDLVASGIVLRNCKFGRNYRYGVIARPDQAGISWSQATNVWFDTGLPVVG